MDLFDPEGPAQIRSNHLAIAVHEMCNHKDAIDPPSLEEVEELIDIDNLPLVLAAVSIALISDQMSPEELEEGSSDVPLFGKRSAPVRPPQRRFGALGALISAFQTRSSGS